MPAHSIGTLIFALKGYIPKQVKWIAQQVENNKPFSLIQ
jgi:hypothetical protein